MPQTLDILFYAEDILEEPILSGNDQTGIHASSNSRDTLNVTNKTINIDSEDERNIESRSENQSQVEESATTVQISDELSDRTDNENISRHPLEKNQNVQNINNGFTEAQNIKTNSYQSPLIGLEQEETASTSVTQISLTKPVVIQDSSSESDEFMDVDESTIKPAKVESSITQPPLSFDKEEVENAIEEARNLLELPTTDAEQVLVGQVEDLQRKAVQQEKRSAGVTSVMYQEAQVSICIAFVGEVTIVDNLEL